ncbi:aldehyde dehydrogenase [Chondromyces crocatus]|uniref:Aldehyde dehydrogenase n=1 Tax=Chondromyces crocatus TaxID=52 RepID=A0A0K1EP96_CHOCO|nr:aldehyde dehydrogenase [Chondromyces crocatus]
MSSVSEGAPPASSVSEGAADVVSPPETSIADLDRAAETLAGAATAFARMSPGEKATLLRSLIPGTLAVAEAQVAMACRAKGLDPAGPQAGEEWLAGPSLTLSNLRRLAESLEDIQRRGRPRLGRGGVRTRKDGRVEVNLFPVGAQDALLYKGVRVHALLKPGATAASVRAEQAAFYQQRDPEGGVTLLLGAGNVASIPPMDALHALFVEGRVVLLKMSPVNAYLGPFLEKAFAPLVERGFLRVVYGGAEVGAHLAAHPAITHMHITGSAETHDRIVWGPPGPEQARRRAAGEPVFTKPVSSELGNVSPVIVLPHLYDEDELWFQARSIATQVINNASFNCNAAKMLVLPRGFAQRPLLLSMLARAFAAVAPRRAYYPGAHDRHARLTAGRATLGPEVLSAPPEIPLPSGVVRFGEPGADALPWTLVIGLDAADPAEPLFQQEPFCSILSVVELGSSDPVQFLAEATRFCNERLWGTLSASLVVHPLSEEDPAVADAVDRALLALRYGAIAVNQWPAMVYGAVTPPWGGHPSATLADVQSGLGFVHNTQMVAGVEKVILRAPLRGFPRPPYFYDHRRAHLVGARLATWSATPGWGRAWSVAAAAFKG